MNKNNIRVVIFCISLCLLTSCSSGTSNTAKLYSKIRTETKSNHSLDHGEIIAKFDLGGITKSDTIFAPYYAKAINSEKDNNKYLRDFSRSFRHRNFIQTNAYEKEGKLAALLGSLNSKYKFLPHKVDSLVGKLIKEHSAKKTKSKNSKRDYFESLASLHNATKFVPIFTPLDQPRVTSKFGKRTHPHKKKIIHHNGLDLAGVINAKIYSAADGIVEEVSRSKGYGNNLIIKHDKDIKTRYAHLSKLSVKQGDRVLLGQEVGVQGNSGTSTGQHLHFEVIIKDKAVDPLPFVRDGV